MAIADTNPVVVIFALATVVLTALWLEAHVGAFKKLGSAATAILMALVRSNVGCFPGRCLPTIS